MNGLVSRNLLVIMSESALCGRSQQPHPPKKNVFGGHWRLTALWYVEGPMQVSWRSVSESFITSVVPRHTLGSLYKFEHILHMGELKTLMSSHLPYRCLSFKEGTRQRGELPVLQPCDSTPTRSS